MVFLKGIEKVEKRKLSKLIWYIVYFSFGWCDLNKRVLGDLKY